ncbi:MAG TPA: hypothetical protein DD434_00080, partial [Bacteroidales bacterium]|nr:hypothetical protein [Bacteroidales bacterium]
MMAMKKFSNSESGFVNIGDTFMNKLLYFPYISIPKSKWLVQTLLYWDEVASIVPFEFTSRPDRLDKHMQILINEQLVTQIFPEDYVSELPDFTENFLRYVDSDPIIKNRSSLVKNNGIIT